MIREYTATGKTVEEAIANAKAGLHAPDKFLLDVRTEVLEYPRKKILGIFGGADAKVKASYDDGVSEKKPRNNRKPKQKKQENKKPRSTEAADPAQKTAKKQENKKPVQKKEAPAPRTEAAEPKKEQKQRKERKNDFPQSVDLDYAKEYLAGIIKGFDVGEIKLDASYADGVVSIDLVCDDFGIIIGRRGETLDSIQYLMSLAMKKHTGTYVRVAINVGNYREKRNETLRHLAQKNSAYVLRTGRRYTFEPMNPYERRVIHTAVQEIEGVESRSIGLNQDRRVVIEPVGGVTRPPRRNGRSRRSDRPKPTTTAPENYVPKADRADLPKFGKIEVNKD